MIGLVIKLIVCPITVLISNYLFGLRYTVFQAVVVGLILAVAAHFMEVLILKRGTFWVSTVGDFVAALGIVYLSQLVFTNVNVTFIGALLTAVLLTVTEYFQHTFLINAGKTKKSEE